MQKGACYCPVFEYCTKFVSVFWQTLLTGACPSLSVWFVTADSKKEDDQADCKKNNRSTRLTNQSETIFICYAEVLFFLDVNRESHRAPTDMRRQEEVFFLNRTKLTRASDLTAESTACGESEGF